MLRRLIRQLSGPKPAQRAPTIRSFSGCAHIPGMIEPIEQRLLFDLAKAVPLEIDDVVCEFGSYFGRSARCLAEGLLGNSDADLSVYSSGLVHVYDLFSCAAAGPLAPYVLRDAKKAGLSGLLAFRDDRIDFSKIFDHHMRDLPPRLLIRHQTDLASAHHDGGFIRLMHIDAPKWYPEYRQLLMEFGPHLRSGAPIVFQDYFYHWSAGIIVAIQLFIEDGMFEPLQTAASSLLVRASAPITPATLATLDARLKVEDPAMFINRAIDFFATFEMDRKSAFLPRLFLAGMQLDFERGGLERSSQWLARLQQYVGAGELPSQVLGDLADLVRCEFSMRRLYALDTAAVPLSSSVGGTQL